MIGDGHTHAMLRRPNGRGQPSRAAPDNEDIRRMRREAHSCLLFALADCKGDSLDERVGQLVGSEIQIYAAEGKLK